MKKSIRIILLITLICIFAYSLFSVAAKVYGYYHDNKQYEQLRAQVGTSSSESPASDAGQANDMPATDTKQASASNVSLPYDVMYAPSENLDTNGVLKEYSDLFNQNNDLAGWIRIPGFKKVIDYPVMQSDDNEFYLKKDFYKNSSLAGSIYMDYKNKSTNDRNIIIYGHAMKDFSMFGNLKDFSGQPDKYNKITKIYFDLMNTHMEYEIFSAYSEKTTYNYRQINFSSDAEYIDFLQQISGKSVRKYNVKLTAEDKILTLSTCTDLSNIRSVIHARLIKQTVYTDSGKKPAEVPDKGQQEEKDVVTANIYLSKFSMEFIRNGKSEKAVTVPAFNNNVREYELSIPPDADKLSILFEAEDPEAKTFLTLNGNEVEPTAISLVDGDNVIKIKVVSQDSLYSRTYTIKVSVQD